MFLLPSFCLHHFAKKLLAAHTFIQKRKFQILLPRGSWASRLWTLDFGLWNQSLGLPLALAILTFALYLPTTHFDFVQYDDNDYVFDNQTVRAGLTWWGLVWSFVDAHALNW